MKLNLTIHYLMFFVEDQSELMAMVILLLPFLLLFQFVTNWLLDLINLNYSQILQSLLGLRKMNSLHLICLLNSFL